MTFLERYVAAKLWHEKVLIISIYHTVMCQKEKGWTLSNTARDFQVSIGLVSENLKLANAIHTNERILKCQTRQEALRKV